MANQDPPGAHKDLASILQTLSKFTGQQNRTSGFTETVGSQQTHVDPVNSASRVPLSKEPDEDEYDPESYNPERDFQAFQSSQRQKQNQRQNVASHAATTHESLIGSGGPDAGDPRSIVTWSAALRYTTRLFHESPAVTERIRTLIKNQHMNERHWWTGREDILKKQKSRDQNRAQIQEVLRSLGGHSNKITKVEEGTENLDYEDQKASDEAAEILAYDLKVHKLIEKMNEDQEREIAALRIPFFGLNGSAKAAFTGDELQAFRQKMLMFLEEYAKE